MSTSSSYGGSTSSSTSSIITVATCTLNQWALDYDGNLERIIESCVIAKQMGATYRLGPELEITGYGCEDHFYESDTIYHSWESLVSLLTITTTTTAPTSKEDDDDTGNNHDNNNNDNNDDDNSSTTNNNITDNMLCDFGMPLLHKGCRYNCRVLCYNRTIVLIRPKSAMADNGNYRESRYFTAYQQPSTMTTMDTDDNTFLLPQWVHQKLRPGHPRKVPFGLGYIESNDGVKVGCESCEELWTPYAAHIGLALNGGVEIIGNGSGSHHELRKLDQRLELMVSATRKSGGIYLYSNQRGCDGGRLYYDGGAIIVCNGQVLAQAPQFSLNDVDVITATVDLDDVRSYRASIPSFGCQSVQQQQQRTGRSIDVPEAQLLHHHHLGGSTALQLLSTPISLHWSTPEEECCLGPACWLWDYLRRSGASGFLLPLSGGADSSAVATIVNGMCDLVYSTIKMGTTTTTITSSSSNSTSSSSVGKNDHNNNNNRNREKVLNDLRRICHPQQQQQSNGNNDDDNGWIPSSSQEIASYILHTIYMGTTNSSQITTSRAKRLGTSIGSYHLTVPIDRMVNAVLQVFTFATNGMYTPKFVVHGGTVQEDLALQNIQARLRMVTAYLFAQLLPWTRGRSGFLLVLGSANVDEGLRGYMTKYDCSSADLNPIGAISKGDLKRMLRWASIRYGYPVLDEIASAPPTAELRPNKTAGNNSSNSGGGCSTDGTNNGDGDGDADGNNKITGSAAAADATAEHSQLDEEEMGMSYDELGWFGRLRKISRCGPVNMYRKLVTIWRDTCTPYDVAVKVKRFFYYYSINRHKMCTLTPSYHAEAYSPDDNRFDLRPFLYNTKWTRQFDTIDRLVLQQQQQQQQQGAESKGASSSSSLPGNTTSPTN